MRVSLVEFSRIVDRIVTEGVTLTFPAGSVKDYVQLAAEMAGVGGSQYKYDKHGSQIEFTSRQFVDFLDFLKDALEDKEMVSEEEKLDIQSTLDHVMKQIPSA